MEHSSLQNKLLAEINLANKSLYLSTKHDNDIIDYLFNQMLCKECDVSEFNSLDRLVIDGDIFISSDCYINPNIKFVVNGSLNVVGEGNSLNLHCRDIKVKGFVNVENIDCFTLCCDTLFCSSKINFNDVNTVDFSKCNSLTITAKSLVLSSVKNMDFNFTLKYIYCDSRTENHYQATRVDNKCFELFVNDQRKLSDCYFGDIPEDSTLIVYGNVEYDKPVNFVGNLVVYGNMIIYPGVLTLFSSLRVYGHLVLQKNENSAEDKSNQIVKLEHLHELYCNKTLFCTGLERVVFSNIEHINLRRVIFNDTDSPTFFNFKSLDIGTLLYCKKYPLKLIEQKGSVFIKRQAAFDSLNFDTKYSFIFDLDFLIAFNHLENDCCLNINMANFRYEKLDVEEVSSSETMYIDEDITWTPDKFFDGNLIVNGILTLKGNVSLNSIRATNIIANDVTLTCPSIECTDKLTINNTVFTSASCVEAQHLVCNDLTRITYTGPDYVAFLVTLLDAPDAPHHTVGVNMREFSKGVVFKHSNNIKLYAPYYNSVLQPTTLVVPNDVDLQELEKFISAPTKRNSSKFNLEIFGDIEVDSDTIHYLKDCVCLIVHGDIYLRDAVLPADDLSSSPNVNYSGMQLRYLEVDGDILFEDQTLFNTLNADSMDIVCKGVLNFISIQELHFNPKKLHIKANTIEIRGVWDISVSEDSEALIECSTLEIRNTPLEHLAIYSAFDSATADGLMVTELNSSRYYPLQQVKSGTSKGKVKVICYSDLNN